MALNENPQTLLRAVVIDMMPQDVRVALGSMATESTLEEIGEQAYKIIDLRKDRKGKGVNAIKRQAASTESDEEEEVNVVMKGKSRSKGDTRRPRNGTKEDGPFVCFAHKKFGQQAFSCKPGCSFADLPLAQRGAGNGNAGR